MIEALYIIALIILLFSTLTGKLKKFSIIFSIFVLIILAYGVSNGLDLYNYNNRYNNILNITSSREIGFQTIMRFFKSINIDFATFRCLMIIISFIIIILNIRKITDDASFFMLAYMSYFALMDIEQIRNFYALIVLVIAFKYLFEDNIRSSIKYVVLILIASSIHSSFIVYILLLIVKSKLNITKLTLRALPVIVVGMLFLVRYTSIQSTLLAFFASDEDTRAAGYSQAYSKLGWIIPAVIYIWNVLIIKYCNILSKKQKWNFSVKKYEYRDLKIIKNIKNISCDFIMNRLYMINLVGLLFIPLYMNSLVFYRINRNIVMINLIFIGAIYNKCREIKKKHIIVLSCTIALIIGYCIFDFNIYYSWEHFYTTYFVERQTGGFF